MRRKARIDRTAPALGRKPHKYGAAPTVVNGIKFPSKREARRWQELQLLEKAGDIRDLKRQPRFALMAAVVKDGLHNINAGTVEGMRIVGEYRADFSYIEMGYRPLLDRFVIEDSKGYRTDLYSWKKRHMKAQYDVDVREV